MVIDSAIVRTGDSTKLDTAILAFERLHLFGTVRSQAILQIDAGERRGKLA